jgi:hypothetical protein
MHFDERNEGDFHIYAGALEGPRGDGYIAAVVVMRRTLGPATKPRELYRDESLACGHRWASPGGALQYAMSKAREVIRSERMRLSD